MDNSKEKQDEFDKLQKIRELVYQISDVVEVTIKFLDAANNTNTLPAATVLRTVRGFINQVEELAD